MTRLRFTVPGIPKPKERPRLGRHGNVYTPDSTSGFERALATYALQAMARTGWSRARTVLLLYRADYYGKKKRGYVPTGEVEVNIAKQNNGPTCLVSMRFEEAFGAFSEPLIADAPPATTYTCGSCGARLEAGRSCACGATSTPAAHAAGCRCPTCDPDDTSLIPPGHES